MHPCFQTIVCLTLGPRIRFPGGSRHQYQDPSEGRIRAGAGPQPQPEVKGEGRMRAEEHRRSAAATPPTVHKTPAAGRQAKPQSAAPTSSNPFGDPDEQDDGDDSKNPFAETTTSAPGGARAPAAAKNPFGDPDDDYDDNLNPFGES